MPSAILTDGATFTCPHQGTGTAATGISISSLAENVTIGGHKPILSGATISGVFAGCLFPSISGGGPPCASFTLQAPGEQTFTIGGQAIYTAADAPTIALAPEETNSQVGLTISEPQKMVTA
jgi:hypothetical protein